MIGHVVRVVMMPLDSCWLCMWNVENRYINGRFLLGNGNIISNTHYKPENMKYKVLFN